MMTLNIDQTIKTEFPDLNVLTYQIKDVRVEGQNRDLETFRKEIVKQVEEQYDLELLKDLPTVRAYRDFFWRVQIDPTKHRPAAEALIRSVLRGRRLPRINTLVDAYNLASMKTEVALAAFDADKIVGALFMRFADEGEEFVGIGMKEPLRLQGGEIVVSDAEKLVAIYPHRDAENTTVTGATRNVLVMVCGVPSVDEGALRNAARVAREFIRRFCGGEASI
jgi:DNA/RNA-binding domain of Phe-tRNA-synthetase-like protein